MSEVKWIKLVTDIFENDKIILIEKMSQGYAILTVWFKLLTMAGKQNNSGVFRNGAVIYDAGMLATIFRMKPVTVQKALDVLAGFEMIRMVNGVITIPNWDKYQNMDKLERAKEQSRIRMENRRKRQKQLAQEAQNVTQNERNNSVTTANELRPVTHTEEEKEEEREEKIKKEEGEKERDEHHRAIARLFGTLCPSLGEAPILSAERHERLVLLLEQFTDAQIERGFSMAESSSFLRGEKDGQWRAGFDWLIDPNNMAKVLSGNYADHFGSVEKQEDRQKSYDLDEFWEAAVRRSMQDYKEGGA